LLTGVAESFDRLHHRMLLRRAMHVPYKDRGRHPIGHPELADEMLGIGANIGRPSRHDHSESLRADFLACSRARPANGK